jgi:hypothetical protein
MVEIKTEHLFDFTMKFYEPILIGNVRKGNASSQSRARESFLVQS